MAGSIQSLQRIYDALSRWDMDEFADDVTHDFELVLPETVPWGGTRHGRDGVSAFAAIFRDHVEGQSADADDFIDADDVVVVLRRLRGRSRAPARNSKCTCARLDAVRRNALALPQLFRHGNGHGRSRLARSNAPSFGRAVA